MPRKHSRDRRPSEPELARHLFNRGAPGTAVFRSDADREHFIGLLGRFLRGPARGEVSLLAFCLLTTHFHLVVTELADGGVARFMQKLIAAYSIHYRREYGGEGPLFDGPYRRKPITKPKQLRWTIGYVNANHPTRPDWRFSSQRFYASGDAPSWLHVSTGLAAFGGPDGYTEFMAKRAIRRQFDGEFFD